MRERKFKPIKQKKSKDGIHQALDSRSDMMMIE
jgi:hypothetical protein